MFARLQYGWSSQPDAPATAQQALAPVAAAVATPVAAPPEPQISIPKINVIAPVVYEPSLKNDDILTALESGVIHYSSTVLPGQTGNAVMFGHSSEDWWKPGDYKFIFVLLDKLVAGDQISINYQSQKYTYEVTGSKIVEATDFSVLDPTPTPTLTLITCSPVGTSLRRLVVTAKQVDPAPGAQAAPSAPAVQPVVPDQSLVGSSGVSTTFLNVLTGMWDGLFH